MTGIGKSRPLPPATWQVTWAHDLAAVPFMTYFGQIWSWKYCSPPAGLHSPISVGVSPRSTVGQPARCVRPRQARPPTATDDRDPILRKRYTRIAGPRHGRDGSPRLV